jgi:hypothetical protein
MEHIADLIRLICNTWFGVFTFNEIPSFFVTFSDDQAFIFVYCQHGQRFILGKHGTKTRKLCFVPLEAVYGLPVIFVYNKVALCVSHKDLVIIPYNLVNLVRHLVPSLELSILLELAADCCVNSLEKVKHLLVSDDANLICLRLHRGACLIGTVDTHIEAEQRDLFFFVL